MWTLYGEDDDDDDESVIVSSVVCLLLFWCKSTFVSSKRSWNE